MLSFCACFFCIISVKILQSRYSAVLYSRWLVGYLGSLRWIYEQTGLTNVLWEQNSFVCGGLTWMRLAGVDRGLLCRPVHPEKGR